MNSAPIMKKTICTSAGNIVLCRNMYSQAFSYTLFHFGNDFNIFNVESHANHIMFNGFLENIEYKDPKAFLKALAEKNMKIAGMRFWWESIRHDAIGISLRDKNTFVDRPVTIKSLDGKSRVIYPIQNRSAMQNIGNQIDVWLGEKDKKWHDFEIEGGEEIMAKDIEEITVSPATEFGKVMILWVEK